METVTLTKRGQISVPAELRKAMQLKPGQRLKCLAISGCEFRVFVDVKDAPGPLSVLGWARRLPQHPGDSTAEVMRELREGER